MSSLRPFGKFVEQVSGESANFLAEAWCRDGVAETNTGSDGEWGYVFDLRLYLQIGDGVGSLLQACELLFEEALTNGCAITVAVS